MSDLASQLDAFAARNGVEAKQGYFIRGDIEVGDGDDRLRTNEAQNYCHDCATGLVETYRKRNEIEETEDEPVVVPISMNDEDCCSHCTKCGALLDYQLTDAGVGQELQHFEDSFAEHAAISADDAYHIARILDAAPGNEEVIKLGQKAVALIPGTNSTSPSKPRTLRP